MTVARTEPALAWDAVIVSPLQEQRPQHALKCLSVAAMILGWFGFGFFVVVTLGLLVMILSIQLLDRLTDEV
jgi:hypothetical protein